MSLSQPLSRYWLPVLLVTAVHAALLAGLRSAASAPAAVPETLDIVILAEAASLPVAPPTPVPPPKTPPQVKPRPVPRTADPVPLPKPADPAPAPPAPADPAPAVPAAPEPVVVPPRIDASYRGNVAPPYPPTSRRLGEEGTVLLRVFVREDGTVGEVTLSRSSGFPRLDRSAIDTVRRWKLIPARRGNTPFATWYTLPLAFNLEK
jgi:protein TonB